MVPVWQPVAIKAQGVQSAMPSYTCRQMANINNSSWQERQGQKVRDWQAFVIKLVHGTEREFAERTGLMS